MDFDDEGSTSCWKSDAVVTDLEMTEMDGIDLTEELNRLSSNVPVMITTNHSDDVHREIAFRACAEGFPIKPCFASDLITRLQLP